MESERVAEVSRFAASGQAGLSTTPDGWIAAQLEMWRGSLAAPRQKFA
jgi:hypothetical protein